MNHTWKLINILNLANTNTGAEIYICENCGYERHLMFRLDNPSLTEPGDDLYYDPVARLYGYHESCNEYIMANVLG